MISRHDFATSTIGGLNAGSEAVSDGLIVTVPAGRHGPVIAAQMLGRGSPEPSRPAFDQGAVVMAMGIIHRLGAFTAARTLSCTAADAETVMQVEKIATAALLEAISEVAGEFGMQAVAAPGFRWPGPTHSIDWEKVE